MSRTPDSAATPVAADIVAVGDLQGCLPSFEALLREVEAASGPVRLWLTGDLVNRGPASLASLRWAADNEARLVTVLGNHDLHLLALACGVRRAHRDDTAAEILDAPDRDDLLDWLRRRPLAHLQDNHLLVHAGVLPAWSARRTVELAGEVEAQLRGPRWHEFLATMYGNRPARWDDHLTGADRLRVIVNALTRLRFCRPDGEMDFDTKDGATGGPPGFMPWFDIPGRASADATVVFGHWSTLGLKLDERLIGLDTGCVWGGHLSAVRLADRALFQVACPQARVPGRR